MLEAMKRYRILGIAQLLLKVGGVAVGLIFALLATLRDILASVDVEQDNDRQLHDSDLSGELNHRTGRLDSGTDPYGWYDRD
jgi:hypothetical protein